MTYRAVSILTIALGLVVPSISGVQAQQAVSEDRMVEQFLGQTRGLKLRNRPEARDTVVTGMEGSAPAAIQPLGQPAAAATAIVVFDPATAEGAGAPTVFAPEATGLAATGAVIGAPETRISAFDPATGGTMDPPAVYVPVEDTGAAAEAIPVATRVTVFDPVPDASAPAVYVPSGEAGGAIATVVPDAPLPTFEAVDIETGAIETVAIEGTATPVAVFEPTVVPSATIQPVEAREIIVVPPADTDYVRQQDENIVQVRVFFEHNSTSLSRATVADLEKVCRVMKRLPAESRFQVIGHTDKSGDTEYNLYLSRNRAREVVRHLNEECDFPSDRLIAIGVGEQYSDPASPAHSSDERRVEFQFLG